MIKRCGEHKCKSAYQDEKYGTDMRVMNECTPDKQGKQYRCTVCQTEHSSGGDGKKGKK